MQHRTHKSLVVTCGLVAALAGCGFAATPAFAATNLAAGKTVTASRGESTASKLVDNDKSKASRWSAEHNVPEWACVDLGEAQTFDTLEFTWESDAEHAVDFKIWAGNDKANLGNPVKTVTGNTKQVSKVTLDAPVTARYVKFEVTKVSKYPNVSCADLTITNESAAQTGVNLAAGKTVTATTSYNNTASRLTDGNKDPKTGRWMTEQAAPQSATVDLGSSQTMDRFVVTWENAANAGKDFKLYVSDNKDNMGDPVASVTGNKDAVSTVKLKAPKAGRYVKLEVLGMNGPYGVSCCELEAYNGEAKPQVDPTVNLAQGKTAQADSVEDNATSTLGAPKAFDGDKATRWSSGNDATASKDGGPHWVYVDLGQETPVKGIRINWHQRKAKGYKIQVATGQSAPAATSDAWKTVYTNNGHPSKKDDVINLQTASTARYVRLYIDHNTHADPDNGVAWGCVGVNEMEVFAGDVPAPSKTPADYLNEITVAPVTAETNKLSYTLPEVPEGYEIKYNGTDYEQVVDADGTIYHPITNVTVKASFKIQNKKDKNDFAFREVAVTVPGTMQAPANANQAPQILPELREWVGSTGSFSGAKRVVYAEDSLKKMAEEFANDFAAITGSQIQVVKGTAAQSGDIFFKLGAEKSKGLKDEGYLLDAKADKITVEAEQVAGANWGGKTILQGIKQSGNNTFPCGVTRDYPLYRVRGLILDVGRKTFTLDWLKQMTEQMAWFKMNDFQVHLNDNFIGLETLDKPMEAYSGFRLESNVKKGGNNGKNKADLTSTDVWYTKKDFKKYIEDSRALGVNIIPEIDTPAHSLALTKVRPDLRTGTSGRQNDHLDLHNQYDESIGFVQDIFKEYMDADSNGKTDASDVFGAADVVHIGADEYGADPNAFRRFNNDMFKFVEDHGKTARVWGSLTSIHGDGSVAVPGVDAKTGKRRQIDLWNWGYANMDKMYADGFDLIDCNDGDFYIVPNAGYYYDYLNDGNCYNNNLAGVGNFNLPAGDPQVAGGAFAVWNDMCYKSENGMSEYDIYDRIQNSMGLFAANAWGKGALPVADAKARSEKLGDDPTVNFGYKTPSDKAGRYAQYNMDDLSDASDMNRDLVEGKNAAVKTVDHKKALELNGGESYVKVKDDALTTLGLGNDLRVKVKRTSADAGEQILFESEYGTIKASQKGTGKVGITRENHDYSFNYTLPMNEWVELEFKNSFETCQLLVNGKPVDTIGTHTRNKTKATCMLPVNTIGSKTHAFKGYIDDVRITTAKSEGEFASTMPLDYAVLTAETVLESQKIDGLRPLLDQAYELMKQSDPAKDQIDGLVGKINALLNNAEGKPSYTTADYCRVDAYKQLLGHENIDALFTPESVSAVHAALAGVRENLPSGMQDTVNAYEDAIVAALDGLKPVDGRDLNFVSRQGMSAEATSQQGGQEPAKAIDGNPDTIWHSKWGNENARLPISITLKKNEVMSVGGVSYTPRKDNGNGSATKFEVEVSQDGKTWKKVALKKDTFPQDASTKVIDFNEPVQCKQVKLIITKAAGNFASAAEIELIDAAAKPDYAGLQAVVDVAKSVKKDGGCKHDVFTDATWNALQDEVKKAEATIKDESGDINSVFAQKQAVARVLEALRLDGEHAPAPKPEPAPGPEKPELTFPDVTDRTEHRDDIYWLARTGVTAGFPDGTFRPYASVTRCDMAAFLYRLVGEPDFEPTAEQKARFKDVDAGTDHAKEIWWLAAQEISTGFGDGTFRPMDTVKRQDMAAFLHRLSQKYPAEKGARAAEFGFADVTAGTPHAEDIAWLAATGVSEGWQLPGGGREFRGMSDVARGDMAAFLHRMDDKGLVHVE